MRLQLSTTLINMPAVQGLPQAAASVCTQRIVGSMYAPVLLLSGLQAHTKRGMQLLM